MSKVTITESNYKQVFGRLKKFFNHDGLLTWHQFDCGMKKRIGHTIHFDGIARLSIPEHTVNVMHRIYRSKHHVSDTKFFFEYSHSDDDFYYDDDELENVSVITLGDEIWFLGNRVIIKRKAYFTNHRHLYMCYQIGGRLDTKKY
jgi:hypothetical protein